MRRNRIALAALALFLLSARRRAEKSSLGFALVLDDRDYTQVHQILDLTGLGPTFAACEELEACVRKPARDVLAVAARREHVQLALPKADISVHVLGLEAPRFGKGEVVVGPAAHPLPAQQVPPAPHTAATSAIEQAP